MEIAYTEFVIGFLAGGIIVSLFIFVGWFYGIRETTKNKKGSE